MPGTPTKYNPLVVWRTYALRVFQSRRATAELPAKYQITTKAVDSNDLKPGTVDAGFYFTDNLGIPFRILSVVSEGVIEAIDDFRTGYAPVSGKMGIIHKSAYKGKSLYLPASVFRFLHPLARENNNTYSLAVLWGNDPNPIRYKFENTEEPSITNYQGIQEDGTALSEDYGEMPKAKLFQIVPDTEGEINPDPANESTTIPVDYKALIERTEKPYFTYTEKGLIDTINFGVLDSKGPWLIEISR